MYASTSARRHDVHSISCGRDHTLALLANGKVFGWGGDGSGRIPLGVPEYCSTSTAPTRAVEIDTRHAMACVSAGHGISLGITVTKRVLVWGSNPAAAGGWGSSHAFVPPRFMAEMANMPTTVHISGGFGFVYMLHFASCVPDIGRYEEYKLGVYGSWFDPPITVRAGRMTVPTGPGVGIKDLRALLKDAVEA